MYAYGNSPANLLLWIILIKSVLFSMVVLWPSVLDFFHHGLQKIWVGSIANKFIYRDLIFSFILNSSHMLIICSWGRRTYQSPLCSFEIIFKPFLSHSLQSFILKKMIKLQFNSEHPLSHVSANFWARISGRMHQWTVRLTGYHRGWTAKKSSSFSGLYYKHKTSEAL